MIFSTGSKNTENNPVFFKILFFTFFLLLNAVSFSQTIITGKSSSYAGDSLFLYTINDRINYTPVLISAAKVDSDGNFKFEFEISEICKVYIDLPVINAFLFVEPDKSYNIRIPKKEEMTDEQFLDPYFSKEYVPVLIVKNPENDINILLIAYNNFITINKNKLLKITKDYKIKKFIDSIEQVSDTFLNKIDNQFFIHYKTTEFTLMKYYFVQSKKTFMADSFFAKLPILYNDAAYMSLFNSVFDSPFKVGNSILPIKSINYCLKKNDFKALSDSVKNLYPEISADFAEIIVIKGLFDKYYEIPEAQKDVVLTLENIKKEDISAENYTIINNFLKDIKSFQPGMKAPELNLPDKKNKNVSLDDFSGEFIYIQFFHPQSYACLQQIQILQSYNEKKIKKLNIITVFVGDNFNQLTDFLNSNKDYKWTFVFADKKNNILKKYKVDVFPKYVLIDPEGKIIMTETPSPVDNFEQTYNEQYSKWFGKN